LALRLIDGGGALVADDRSALSLDAGRVFARAPDAIHGKLEVRGIGIVRVAALTRAPLTLVVDLAPLQNRERMPPPETVELLGISVRAIRLAPFEASTPAKIRLAVRAGADDIEV
jgi:serine kinase of HPr protein (carbohydrate metabolism regulator)